VRWAVAQGIADPDRVAVLGDSFGGFSVLAQLTRAPGRYACGVDVVGIADWLRWLDAKPPYWRHHMHWWTLFLDAGDTDADRRRLRDASPLARIASIRAPLLVIHGANDVRVTRRDADEVVERLRRLGRPVQYVLFEDEGHTIRQSRNRVRMWRTIEDFLAGCLGGRSSGFDPYEARPRRGGAAVTASRVDTRRTR
jgi:dipeptidyl aminopeptidase/acylaminoacyl peptidase